MSRLVDRVRHQFSSAHPAKRAGMVLLALGAFSVVGTSASAYWTTQGAGTASASTGTLNAAAAPVAGITGPGAVHLTWTGSTLSNGAPAQGYYVTRSSGSVTSCGTAGSPLPAAATSCDDTGVPDGTYSYTLTAVYAGWTAPSGSSNSVTVDNDSSPPTVTINQAAGQNDPTNNGTILFTATFSEPVTGFTTSDVTVSGSAGGSWSVAISGSGPSYTATVSGATGNGTIMATIGASKVQDLAGNNNNASTSTDNTVTLDTTAPVAPSAPILSAASDSGSSNADRITNVTTPTFSGTAETGATVRLFAGATPVGSGVATAGTYSITSSALAPDAVKAMTVKATDVAGNQGVSSTVTIITIDTNLPVVTLASTPSSPNGANGWNRSAVTWTPSGSDLNGVFSCQAALTYTTPDSPTASVTRTCTDIAGNLGTATATFKYDGTAPSGGVTSPANAASIAGTSVPIASTNALDTTSGIASVQFQVKPVAGTFTSIGAADTTSPYTTSWDTTTVLNGSYVLQTVVTDAAGNTLTSAGTSVLVNNPPTVTINQAISQADPVTSVNTVAINFTVVFSQPVTGFTASDVTFSGTAGGTKTVAISGSGATYIVAVAGMTSGTLIPSLPAAAASDATGNPSAASTSTDQTVTYTQTATALSATYSDGNPGQGDLISGTATPGAMITITESTPTSGTTFSDTADPTTGAFNIKVANLKGKQGDVAYGYSVTAQALGYAATTVTLGGNDSN